MSQPLAVIIALVAGYLLGTFPSAYLMGRLRKGIDIRTVGSHNMGAMNSFYNLGFIYGVLVLALDLGKGAAAVALASGLGIWGHLDVSWWIYIEMVAGLCAVLGHNYPVWLHFKGGKGGATVIGVVLFFIPWGYPIGFAIFLVLLALIRVPTISYGIAMVSFPFIAWFIYGREDYTIFSALMILVPFVNYIPRLFEMRQKGGSWKRVFARKSIKDRL